MVELPKYQRIGVGWLCHQEKSVHRGGILADEMGLGKTVQTVGLMLANTPGNCAVGQRRLRTLVVVTTSLMGQWKEEVSRLSRVPLDIVIHHGPKRTQEALDLANQDVVITSYGTVLSEVCDTMQAGFIINLYIIRTKSSLWAINLTNSHRFFRLFLEVWWKERIEDIAKHHTRDLCFQ